MDIFVDAAASAKKSDGTAANPFVTIADALKALLGAVRVPGMTDRIIVRPGI